MSRERVRTLSALAIAVVYIALEHMLSTETLPTTGAAGLWRLWPLAAFAPLLAVLWLALRRRLPGVLAVAMLVAALAVLSGYRQHWLLAHMNLYYWLQGVAINAALALYFGASLRAGHVPVCTRIAALTHGEPAPLLARYTRRVTQAWTAFFIVVAAVSTLLFTIAGREAWSLFANVCYAPLLGLMFAGEYLLRYLLLPPALRGHWLDAMRGFRRVRAAE